MFYIRAVVDCCLYCNKQYEYEVELKLITLACTRIKLNSGTYNFLSRNFVCSNSFIWFCSFHFVSGDLTVIIINLHIYIYCLRCNEHPQETSRFAALQLQWAMMPTAFKPIGSFHLNIRLKQPWNFAFIRYTLWNAIYSCTHQTNWFNIMKSLFIRIKNLYY